MSKKNLNFIITVLFWLGMVASTFVLLVEVAPKSGGWPYWDKVEHIFGFTILTIFGYLSYTEKKIWVCIGLAIYGALIEYLQNAFTLTRMASLGDWAADIVGIVLATAIIFMIKNLRAKNTIVLGAN